MRETKVPWSSEKPVSVTWPRYISRYILIRFKAENDGKAEMVSKTRILPQRTMDRLYYNARAGISFDQITENIMENVRFFEERAIYRDSSRVGEAGPSAYAGLAVRHTGKD